MKKITTTLLLLQFSLITFAQLEIPKSSYDSPIINHYAYSLQYSEEHEQALWVGYELSIEETGSLYDRTNNFRADPRVSTRTAQKSDYAGSGYDRGHLAPAGDMAWSSTAMSESFYYSNMSPQLPGFNRGVWKRLESLIRTWARENKSVYVITGPVLSDEGLTNIGSNNVTVPKRYYKVILDYTEPNIKAIGFVISNESSKANLSAFAVSVDYVESITGFDFFAELPDSIENKLEASTCIDCWSSSKSKSSSSVQCSGVTQKGLRCKNKTHNELGYCHHHVSQAKGSKSSVKSTSKKSNYSSGASRQCSGTTQKGSRCKRRTKAANGRCYQH